MEAHPRRWYHCLAEVWLPTSPRFRKCQAFYHFSRFQWKNEIKMRRRKTPAFHNDILIRHGLTGQWLKQQKWIRPPRWGQISNPSIFPPSCPFFGETSELPDWDICTTSSTGAQNRRHLVRGTFDTRKLWPFPWTERWMNIFDWMNGWMKERTNERMNELINCETFDTLMLPSNLDLWSEKQTSWAVEHSFDGCKKANGTRLHVITIHADSTLKEKNRPLTRAQACGNPFLDICAFQAQINYQSARSKQFSFRHSLAWL